MKKLNIIIGLSVVVFVCLIAFILFGGKTESAKIIVATDMHYLSDILLCYNESKI